MNGHDDVSDEKHRMLERWIRRRRLVTTKFTVRTATRSVAVLIVLALVWNVLSNIELRDSIQKRITTSPSMALGLGGQILPQSPPPVLEAGKKREKATLLMLARNDELDNVLSSMRQVEDRFNKNYNYPWTFMNNEPFTEEFMQFTTGLASGTVEYVLIQNEHWKLPSSVNETKVNEGMAQMKKQGVIYGDSLSYRHMCRFNSGFFFQQAALDKYDWYWRVEPDIQYHCDITYDPFTFLRENNKTYGWVLSMHEFPLTIPTLWHTTQEFALSNRHHVSPNNSLNWITNPDVKNAVATNDSLLLGPYNNCHFWSNFEIANLNFFRGEAYRRYFEHLDATGGFFYERWGDAPVHSIALTLFLPRTAIHHFSDFGYTHFPATRCPTDDESRINGRCVCAVSRNYDNHPDSCSPSWFKLNGAGKGVTMPKE